MAQVIAQVDSYDDFQPQDSQSTLAVVGYPVKTDNSLEFRSYRNLFENRFRAEGFTIVSADNSPDLIAFVSYGIDSGETTTSISSVPQFGQTGGGTTTYSGSFSSGGSYGYYSGSAYSMPTYGITGYSSRSVQQDRYTRKVAIDMVDASTLNSDKPRKVCEMRLISKGNCGAISEVMDEFVEIIFKNYPNTTGKVVLDQGVVSNC